MSIVIQALLIAVLLATFLAVGRLYFVLGSARAALHNIEVTRQQVSATMQSLDRVAESMHRVLEDEITPTLQIARETLVNVEVTTRALADTTQAVRRLTGKAEAVVQTQNLIRLGAPALGQIVKRSATAFTGLLSGIGAGWRLATSRRSAKAPVEPSLPVTAIVSSRMLPSQGAETNVPAVRQAPALAQPGKQKR